jgi:hypothetical protein
VSEYNENANLADLEANLSRASFVAKDLLAKIATDVAGELRPEEVGNIVSRFGDLIQAQQNASLALGREIIAQRGERRATNEPCPTCGTPRPSK